MKTILITALQAVEVKNILRAGVTDRLLADSDIRIVCVARRAERIPYYQKEFGRERLTFDALESSKSGVRERLFRSLKFFLIRTATTDLRRYLQYRESGAVFSWACAVLANRLLSRRWVRTIVRFLDQHLVRDPAASTLLQKHAPDAVFVANLFDDHEIGILREAKRRGIPTVGFVNSWDKPTARWAMRLLPDTLAVYNEIVSEEATRLGDIEPERVKVCGIPQYDQYINQKPRPREDFFKTLGLDPARRLILFAPLGPGLSDSDWEATDLLWRLVEEERRIPNAQLLVRFQPNDFIDKRELARRPWLRRDLPGVRYGSERGGDWDMTRKDLQRLTDTLAHSDVVACYMSSIAVDAALMGKPVINIGFEFKDGPATKRPTEYYKAEHYSKALATGGIRMTRSPEELVEWLTRYLDNPTLDREGRERLVREQCWKTDGKSSERLARVIRGAIQARGGD